MLDDLTALANLNSGSHNLPGLATVADWLEDWMSFEETRFERIALPPRATVEDSGEIVRHSTGPALRWDHRPESPRRILLAIHYDTVFGIDHDFQTCQLVDSDRLQGPGVADAKGGIIILRNALLALRQFNLLGDIGWTVLLNPDEELGSPSSTGLLREVAAEFDFGLLFEPALPTGALVSQRKGSGNYDIVVRGRAAHAGRHFEDGRNAVALLSRLMCELDRLNGERSGTTVNVGYVRGGGPVNVVPDLAIGRFNVRLQDDASVTWFKEKCGRLIAEANTQDGFQVELHGGITSPPKGLTQGTKHLMAAVDIAQQDAGGGLPQWVHTGGVCDGNKLAAAGLPNIDTLGPIGDGLHSSCEWVQVSSLPQKAKVIVSLISRYAAREFAQLERTAGEGGAR